MFHRQGPEEIHCTTRLVEHRKDQSKAAATKFLSCIVAVAAATASLRRPLPSLPLSLIKFPPLSPSLLFPHGASMPFPHRTPFSCVPAHPRWLTKWSLPHASRHQREAIPCLGDTTDAQAVAIPTNKARVTPRAAARPDDNAML